MSELRRLRSQALVGSSALCSLLIAVLVLGLLGCTKKQVEPVDLVWTDFAEVQPTFPRCQRPVFLYVSQNACEWCEHMDSLVFARPEIARHLNENYINVNINVDLDLPVTIQGKLYHYQEFFNLLNMREIPAYYFFDTDGRPIGVLSSAMPVKTFKQLLVYVKNRHFYRTRWEDFLKLPESNLDTVWGEF
ncbi:MAG: DUF255 domain-containing protein [Candidatus Zixiibacteriota bacterium]|nr:MAG: DUF255 domain-containing protein [candidate division Zixibacteria bacterium]